MTQTKPKLVINNVPTVLPWPGSASDAVTRARIRFGREFANAPGSGFRYVRGEPAVLTVAAVARLAADNAKRRAGR